MNFKSILLSVLFIFGLIFNSNAYDNIYQIYDDGSYAQVATYDETSFTYHHLGDRDIVEGGVAVNEYGENKIVYFQYHPHYNNLWIKVGENTDWKYIEGNDMTLDYIYASNIAIELLDRYEIKEENIYKFVPDYKGESLTK